MLNKNKDRKLGLIDDRLIYAVVLISKIKGYLGHIYTWINLNKICFAIGIRAQVEAPIFRITDVNWPQMISRYLIEGVIRFARHKGAEKIIITNPLPIMQRILLSYRFTAPKGTLYSKTEIGGVLASECGDFGDEPPSCYERDTRVDNELEIESVLID